MPVSAPLRLPRALVVTALVLGLAAAAHTAGGGHLPAAPVFALLAVLVLLPVTVLARRRLTFPVLTGVLGAGQVALHGAFTSFSPPIHCGTVGVAAHTHHQAAVLPECVSAQVADDMVNDLGLISLVMLAAHALAVAVTALLLAHGEVLLWRMLAWLIPGIPVTAVMPPPEWPAPATPRTVFRLPLRPFLRARTLRGPPQRCLGPATTIAQRPPSTPTADFLACP
jgi:hypothetical protein